jgi:hypothetical protein
MATAYAVFYKENRAKFANATNLDRKFGFQQLYPLPSAWALKSLAAPKLAGQTARARSEKRPAASSSTDGILDLAVFDFFPAIDAVRSPGKRFQPLQTDGLAAMNAIAVRTLIQSFQGQTNERELFVPAGALAEKHLFLIGLHSLIGCVQGSVCRNFAALLNRRKHRLFQLSFLAAEALFKSFYGFWIVHHVSLPLKISL